MVWIALALPILIGAIALGTDVSVLYWNWAQLQKAADAGVLAGANYLPDNPSQAVATAQQYAETDGVQSSEISSTTVGNGNLQLTMVVSRTIPYSFARILGLTNGTVSASASAGPQPPTQTVGASSPSQVTNGDNNGNSGSYCSGAGGCELIPIGLDKHTTYQDGQQIVLQQGEAGPGSWDLLALGGGPGGNGLRGNVANGYSGPVSVGDNLTTEPGQQVGPVDLGFQDRLDAAQSIDPSGTYSSHDPKNPRVMVLPVVDWENQSGSSVPCTAFATVWLDRYSAGQVTVHFISQVVANSFGSSSATSFGARGIPNLLQ